MRILKHFINVCLRPWFPWDAYFIETTWFVAKLKWRVQVVY